MEELKLEPKEGKDGKVTYTLTAEELAEVIQRATMAGQAASAPAVDDAAGGGEIDPLAAMAGGM